MKKKSCADAEQHGDSFISRAFEICAQLKVEISDLYLNMCVNLNTDRTASQQPSGRIKTLQAENLTRSHHQVSWFLCKLISGDKRADIIRLVFFLPPFILDRRTFVFILNSFSFLL